jgi:cytochrome b6-f complex iron-sulfur subunit
MSVADILAAARREKAAGAPSGKASSAGKESPAGKPAPKPQPAAKGGAATATAEKPKPSGPKDTASILAAARKSDKPGPVPRSEAAARQETAAEAPKRPAKQRPQVPPMPQRPDYARPRETSRATAERSERRGFLAAFLGILVASPLAVGFSSLAVTHLLWVLGLARYMFPNILTEPPTRFKVGFPDEYGPGMVETRFKAQFGVWVVRADYEGETQIFALKSVCTHLGCTPNWLEGEQKFKCPCHGSGFYKDGINFEGPAPRPLERYAILIADDGQIEVDKSRTFQQELGQWTDSSSFVPV